MSQPTSGNYCHVEIITPDPEASAAFYEHAFGWKVTRFGAEMQNYIMYEAPGGITGGFRKPEPGESPGVLTYVASTNLDADVAKLTRLGAVVVSPRAEVPGMGSMIVLAVPGGTVQALWQPIAQ